MQGGTVKPEAAAIPLVVDLDGTLVQSDTLHEALLAYLAAAPFTGLRNCIGWLPGGKTAFKAELAARRIASPASLQYDQRVLDRIAEARASGREIYLVSASHQAQVSAISEHLGLFDDAVGSDPSRNLGGAAKAAYLCERFGAGQYEYIGDSATDLPVWQSAGRAVTVGVSSNLRSKVAEIGVEAEHIPPLRTGAEMLSRYLAALRPHQWLKNLLVFAPVAAAHDFSAIGDALLAFIAFSLLASSVYIINDLLDIEADRAHPRKRRRPFAAAEIPIVHGAAMAAGLFSCAVVIAALVNTAAFFGVLLLYYAITFAYSFWLKRRLLIDIWTLAGLYTLRIVAGAAATGIPLTLWFLGFSIFLFLALAAVKRHAELADQMASGGEALAGRAYRVSDIPFILALSLVSGFSAVLVLALYVSNPAVTALYAQPLGLWLICPVLLFWLTRVVMLTHRGEMHDDPVVFAIKDRVSLALGALAGALAVASAVL